MEILFIPMALIAGGLLPVQGGANAQLARAVDSPMAATTLQLSIGALLLLTVTLITGTLAPIRLLPSVPWWHAIGGAASAIYVVSTILLFPRLGAVVSVGLIIAGQMLVSFALDSFGWLGLPATGLRAGGVLGTLMILLAAILIVRGQDAGALRASGPRWGWILLACAAGAVLPIQAALNALLRHDLDGAAFLVATLSFCVATVAMLVVLLGVLIVTRQSQPRFDAFTSMPWWGWVGGFAGATYVTTMFCAIPAIGAGATVGLTVAGQQLASVLIDRFGWLRLPRRPVSPMRLAGLVLLFVGVALIQWR